MTVCGRVSFRGVTLPIFWPCKSAKAAVVLFTYFGSGSARQVIASGDELLAGGMLMLHRTSHGMRQDACSCVSSLFSFFFSCTLINSP